MVIPDTGLLLLPTSPTIRAETAAKKNPKIIITQVLRKLTGIAGSSHIANPISIIPTIITLMDKSCWPSSSSEPFLAFLTAARKVCPIIGRDLIRLIIPAAATAPAPI